MPVALVFGLQLIVSLAFFYQTNRWKSFPDAVAVLVSMLCSSFSACLLGAKFVQMRKDVMVQYTERDEKKD